MRFFWVFEHDLQPGHPYVYRSMADGCAELVLHYKGTFTEMLADGTHVSQPRLLLHGQSQHYRRFITKDSFGIFGAYIYPFALKPLLGVAAPALSNIMPGLDDIVGIDGRMLEEALMNTACNTERAMLTSQFLLRRLLKYGSDDDALNFSLRHIISQPADITVSRMAAQHNISTRQLERRFKEVSGFSPKLYLRIMRFHHALKHYGNANLSLTQLAYECGYYDQSHFINDFKAFSGYQPRTYFSGDAEGLEYKDV